MSLFRPDFNKAGKGVEKNELRGNAFEIYSKIYTRNFFKLVRINALYFLASIPVMLLLTVLFALFLYPYAMPIITEFVNNAKPTEQFQVEAIYTSVMAVLFIAEMLLLFGSGPVSTFFSYAIKCVIDEEHIWYFDDLKANVKENFWKGTVVWIIAIIVSALALIAIVTYFMLYKTTGSIIFLVLLLVVLMMLLIFVLMHNFIYPLMVTFDAGLGNLYKNSFILTIAKLPHVFIPTLISVVFTGLLFSMVSPVVTVIISAVLWIVVMRFPMEYVAHTTIKSLVEKEKGQEE